MIGVNILGIIVTAIFIGPRYLGFVLLGIIVQEAGRVLVALSMGTEIHEVWLGGFFGYAISPNPGGVPTLLLGPAFSLLMALSIYGKRRPGIISILNPAERHDRPFAAVLTKLALGSLLVSAWRLIPK